MLPNLAEFIISDGAEAAISEAVDLLQRKVETVAGISRLRKRMDSEQAGAVWKTAQIRCRAAEKLGELSSTLSLDQDGYEMSSGAAASAYHAQLLKKAGAAHVIDLCAGLGLDTLAFARCGIAVTAYEADPGRAILLAENVRRSGLGALVKTINKDVTVADLPEADAAFFDPARRSGTRRWVNDDEQTVPPLSFIKKISECGISNILVKLSPAADRSVAEQYGGALQLVSVKGECKEALLLMGDLNNDIPRAAVLLPDLDVFSGGDAGFVSSEHGAYLWEPDAAIIRAGLTGALAASLDGWQCDTHNDYFFTKTPSDTAFATCYRVLVDIPYSRKGLQTALAGTGKVIVKQRGFPQSIEEVQSKLKLTTSNKTSTVVLASFNGENFAMVVERLPINNIQGHQ
jgi:hypothetical protein